MAHRPNVLLIVFDTLSAKALKTRLGTLPNLQAFRSKAICFDNAMTCSPEAGPSRATLFTGLDMAAHGVWSDGVSLPKREIILPEVFGRNGYATWLVGRRHLAGVAHWTTEHARPYEYHRFDWAHGPLHRSRQNAYLTWLQRNAPEAYAEIFPMQANPDDTKITEDQRVAMAALPDELSFNSWVADQSIAHLGAYSDRPFLGIVGFVIGATGGARETAGPCFEDISERALAQCDAALARIVAALPADTIVVVTSGRGDNGRTDIPLMLLLPDQPPQIRSEIVGAQDIAPTLYDLAGLLPPPRLQGGNLLTQPSRGWALSRLRHPDLPHETTLVEQDWKLVMTQSQEDPIATTSYQLYDLRADPNALRNLATAPEHADSLEHMIDKMIDTKVALEDRTEPRIASF
ncbi:sulfatase-like hydrolase/transferase [Planktotalea sp.]|uniref:sulfatase family protein n=1 Tax=Planktotalea sp. TaxID=2029877 RepID=UPI003297D68A